MWLDYTKTSPDTAPIPPTVLCSPPLIIQVEGQNKGRGYCGCVCACACICACALCVGGGCVKEEVLSGTEAFCRCCREERVNGKFCGYQSYSTLWLAEVCHMWPQPNSVSVLDLLSLMEWSLKSLDKQSDWEVQKVRENIKRKVGREKEEEKFEKHVY